MMPLKKHIKLSEIITDHPVTVWLKNRNSFTLSVYISVFAFLTYFCMYGLRKPFTAGEFRGLSLWGIDYKPLLIISQVIGYAISKFIGIKVISEMHRSSRALSIIMLTVIAEIALILFSLIPLQFKFLMLILNGLPLGMIWGLVFSYLEGRRTTEILGTILSISFIISSGVVKSTGKLLMNNFHLSDFQMPWITGMIFLIPLILFVWLLDKTPDPSESDIKLRTRRIPMDKKQRKYLFHEFAPGVILLSVAYILLTVFRDLRDNFAVEIWDSIGIAGNSMIFTWSEIPVALTVFIVMSSLIMIKNNRKALLVNNFIILSGFVFIGFSTLLLKLGTINSITWMIFLGLGTYLGYLPFNCLLFDRLIATFGSAANAGFFIYIADSFGYLGSVGILLFKNFNNKDLSWFNFLIKSSYGLAISGTLLILFAIYYFIYKFPVKEKINLSVATAT
jgi:MFS family permease